MHPAAKGEVRRGLARGIKFVRVNVDTRIAPRRPEHQRNLVPWLEGMPANVDRFIGIAREHVQWRIETQQFLDQTGDLIRAEGTRGSRFDQAFHCVSKTVDGGLVPCVKQEDTGADHLVAGQFRAVFFGGNQFGDQVIARIIAAFFDIAVQEGGEFHSGLVGGVLNGPRAPGLIHRHHRAGPTQQVWTHLFGHSQQSGDHAHGHVLAIAGDQVKFPTGQAGQQIGTNLVDVACHPRNPARGESMQDQTPQAGVFGGFQFQQRVPLNRVKGAQVIWHGAAFGIWHCAAKPLVAQQAMNGRMIKSCKHAVFLPVHHRTIGSHPIIEGIGVLDEIGGVGRLDQHVRCVTGRAALGKSGQSRRARDKLHAMNGGVIRRLAIVLAFLAAVAAVAGGVWRYGYVQALDQLARQGASDLTLASDRLKGQLQRYRELAVLVADHPQVGAVLAGEDAAQAEALLLDIADKTAAEDILLTDANGVVMVGARGATDGVNIGPLVQRAMQGALGWGSGQTGAGTRVFSYAAPVFDDGARVSGAVVVSADLSSIEWDWVGSNPAVFFTDASDRVFITNRSEIVFWQRPQGAPGLTPVDGRPLPFDSYFFGEHEVWQMGWGPYLPRNALHISRRLPVIGMTGEALIDVAPARRLARLQAAAVAGVWLAFGALLFLATERRRTLAQANALLEARVAERTEALLETNTQLRREAEEREEAQAALARAQADLVQAGKLSALGQMSAGLSHELNQPLMAIQNYAENAEQFLERNKTDRVGDNLGRISDMARRMGRIIKNLRAFSRQESAPAVRVDLVAVLESALELTAPRLRQEDVTLVFDPPATKVWVSGGEVRLGQVFVNLITNAVDAMAGRDLRVLTIEIAQSAVHVRDTGPGIERPERVFDPFYSTKEVGASEGMGLGLSISYGIVQSFGGEIRSGNGPQGAEFVVDLLPWVKEVAA